MNVQKTIRIGSIAAMCMVFSVSCSNSNESMSDEIGSKTKDAYKNTKNEVCEMVNGKMECAAKRVKDEAKDLVD